MKKEVIPISIIIPTYCEEKNLPILLESIKNQSVSPSEVIVADAQSKDNTRNIAIEYGAIVVEGGKIAFGRNAGAKVAKSKIIIFVDADSEFIYEDFLYDLISDFQSRNLDIASAMMKPLRRGATIFGFFSAKFLFCLWNSTKLIQQHLKRIITEGGVLVIVKKSSFDAVGGFDESYAVGEDKKFFIDTLKMGYKYGHIRRSFGTSVRRYNSFSKVFKSVLVFSLLNSLSEFTKSKKLRAKVLDLYGNLGGGKELPPLIVLKVADTCLSSLYRI